MSDPTVTSYLTKLLCSHGGNLERNQLDDLLELPAEQIEQILKDEPLRFPQMSRMVLARSPLRICTRYLCLKGKEDEEEKTCPKLHLCRQYLWGQCPPNRRPPCRFSHSILSDHNRAVLKANELSRLNEDEIKTLLSQNDNQLLPESCKKYMHDNCDQGEGCARLHVCGYFIRGECNNRFCKRSHDLLGADLLLNCSWLNQKTIQNFQMLCKLANNEKQRARRGELKNKEPQNGRQRSRGRRSRRKPRDRKRHESQDMLKDRNRERKDALQGLQAAICHLPFQHSGGHHSEDDNYSSDYQSDHYDRHMRTRLDNLMDEWFSPSTGHSANVQVRASEAASGVTLPEELISELHKNLPQLCHSRYTHPISKTLHSSPNLGHDPPKQGSDPPKWGCDLPKLGFDLPKIDYDPQKLGHEYQTLCYDPEKWSHDSPRLGHDLPTLGYHSPKQCHDPPILCYDPPTLGYDPPRLVHDPPRLVHDPPKLSHYLPQSSRYLSKLDQDPSKLSNDLATLGYGPPTLSYDIPKWGYDQSKLGYEPPKRIHDSTKLSHYQPKLGRDPPTLDYDPPILGNDPPILGYDPPKLGHDLSKPGHNPPTLGYDPPTLGYDPPNLRHDESKLRNYPAKLGRDPSTLGYDQSKLGYDPSKLGQDPPTLGYKPPTLGYDLPTLLKKEPSLSQPTPPPLPSNLIRTSLKSGPTNYSSRPLITSSTSSPLSGFATLPSNPASSLTSNNLVATSTKTAESGILNTSLLSTSRDSIKADRRLRKQQIKVKTNPDVASGTQHSLIDSNDLQPKSTSSVVSKPQLTTDIHSGTLQKDKCAKMYYHLPYRWRKFNGTNWEDLPNMNKLEKAFCNPRIDRYYSVDFQLMRSNMNPVRRLSIPSSLNTKWIWYWKDELGTWNKYRQSDTNRLSSSLLSSHLETIYLSNTTGTFWFTARKQEYILNCQKMRLKNVNSMTNWEVRRRPTFLDPDKVEMSSRRIKLKASNLKQEPAESSLKAVNLTTLADKGYQNVPVPQACDKFANIVKMFSKTLPGYKVERIWRVLNPTLWQAYQSKTQCIIKVEEILAHACSRLITAGEKTEPAFVKEICVDIHSQKDRIKMEKPDIDVDDVELFYGTDCLNVNTICKDNFDWDSHASLYGQVNYFARDASYAHKYSPVSSRGTQTMFVARVLVHNFAKSNPAMGRSPQKIKTPDTYVNKPSIVTVFERAQVFPEYVLEYRKKSACVIS